MEKRQTSSLIFALVMAFFFSTSVAAQEGNFRTNNLYRRKIDPRTGTHLYSLSYPANIQKQGILPGIDRPEVNFWDYIGGLTVRKVFDPGTQTYLHYLSNPFYDVDNTEFTLRLYSYYSPFGGQDTGEGVSFNLYLLKDVRVDVKDQTTEKIFYSKLDVIFQGNNWDDERFFRVIGEVMRSARFARANGKTMVLRFKIAGMGYGINLDREGEVSSVNGPEIFVDVENSYFEDAGKG